MPSFVAAPKNYTVLGRQDNGATNTGASSHNAAARAVNARDDALSGGAGVTGYPN
jgi:hypothetical protein